MPLYEYQCQKCGERMEVIQRIAELPSQHCPKCGAEMKKLLSAPAIQFKGSGFYKTDYANKSTKSDTSTDTKSEAKSSTTSETKSDTKSETKTDTKSDS